MYAAENGNIYCVKALLDFGASVKFQVIMLCFYVAFSQSFDKCQHRLWIVENVIEKFYDYFFELSGLRETLAILR